MRCCEKKIEKKEKKKKIKAAQIIDDQDWPRWGKNTMMRYPDAGSLANLNTRKNIETDKVDHKSVFPVDA